MDWQIFWTVLGGAFGGALIGALATILVTRMNHRHEHRKWLREERLNTYVEFIRIADALSDEERFLKKHPYEMKELSGKIIGTLARIDLLAPDSVVKSSRLLRLSLGQGTESEEAKKYEKRFRHLTEVMRGDMQGSKTKKREVR